MPRNQPPRITLGLYGPRGKSVRVLLSRDEETVIVQRFVRGKREILRSYPNTTENKRVAKLWAKTFAAESDRPEPRRLYTVHELWLAYKAANFDRLRPRTRVLYESRWKRWELFYGADSVAQDAGLHDFDRLRAALTIALNQRRAVITVVKLVFKWGRERGVLERNDVAGYVFKFPKDQQPLQAAEYSQDEYDAILKALGTPNAKNWRAITALTIAGHQGARIKAVLHLRWEDIGDSITWQGAYDKTGQTWSQPIREETRKALALAFQCKPKAFSPWVLPGLKDRPYRYQSLWYQLSEAEKRAGLQRLPYRATHGLRRKVVGDVFGVTGSIELAGEFIGQKEVETTRGYLRDRGRRQDVADALDRHETVTAGVGSGSPTRATGRNRTDDHSRSKGQKPHPKRAARGQRKTPKAPQKPETRTKGD